MKNLNESLKQIPIFKQTVSQYFHEETKVKKLVKSLDPNKWPPIWKIINFKSYPRYPIVDLPNPFIPKNISLRDCLYQRHSSRKFSQEPLTLQDVSNLLYYSSGIKGSSYIIGGERFYPSAGARYPLEIYLLIQNVKGIKPGVYHYYVKKHYLEELYLNKDMRKEFAKITNVEWALEAPLLLLISSVFYRNQIKYSQRGYRHILSEVGFLSQNIYLLSAAIKLGCCSLGGYCDDAGNTLLDLEPEVESIVGALALGKPI